MNCPRTSNQERAKWRTECREKLASHIRELTILPTDVKLITKPEDLYQGSILTAGKAALFNKQLSKHSTEAYIDLCNGVGVHFTAVLAEGAADYGQQTRLVTTSIAFDALEKSREHPSSDTITPQLRYLGYSSGCHCRGLLHVKQAILREMKAQDLERLRRGFQ
jgi:hypothetical protein